MEYPALCVCGARTGIFKPGYVGSQNRNIQTGISNPGCEGSSDWDIQTLVCREPGVEYPAFSDRMPGLEYPGLDVLGGRV